MMTLPYPYSSSARFYALRLLPGQEVFSQLHAFAQQHQLHAAWIAGCTGSLLQICAYDANIAFKISAILFVWKSV